MVDSWVNDMAGAVKPPMPPPSGRISPKFRRLPGIRSIALCLMAFHACLLCYAGYQDAPTEIEIAHLPAGISHWETGSFYFFRQNPPLVRLVASLPVVCVPHRTEWNAYSTTPGIRPEFWLGHEFLKANGSRSSWLYALARWACIPFSLLGAWISFLWARELFGELSGLMAITLWCFCPMILGHGHLINPDVGAASLGIAAAYAFRQWLHSPTWRNAAITGLVSGLALLTKLPWLILLGLWPLLWV